MMKLLKSSLGLLLLSLLAACGGGGGSAGTPVLGGGGTTVPLSDLVVVLSAASVPNNGITGATATITAVDANRNALPNVPITLSADNGGVLTVSGTGTDGTGKMTAEVGIGSDRSVRSITITATSGTITRSVKLAVTEATATAVASDMVLVISSATIANNGSQSVTATATALDAKRNVLPGVGVALSVDNNATIAPDATTTDVNGVVKGVVAIGGDRSNRTIRVTATSGTIVRTVLLQVTDAASTVPVAADLSLTLSAPTLVNAGTTAIVATATAVDSNRNAVSGIPVTIMVDSSALAVVNAATTDATGTVKANVTIGADRSNRVVTVTATSGTLNRKATFRVIGADLGASFTPLVDVSSTNNQIEFKLVDTNALAMVDQEIKVSAPGLPTATGKTYLNGKFVYTYTAPAVTGTLTITASAAGDSETLNITVQPAGGGTVPQAPEVPQSASIAPSPSVVSVNTVGSQLNQAELRALFLGANNKPVPRVRARFDLAGNANSSDATVTWLGGAYAYSDASGVARATLIPGQRSSPTDGITVRVCYDTIDFPPTSCPKSAIATMTIASEALSVSIRTNELLKSGAADLTYIKEYVVLVVDAAGQAKSDVLITPSVDLTGYYKGYYNLVIDTWVRFPTLDPSENYRWDANLRQWLKAGLVGGVCPNDDVNRNAVREAAPFVAGSTPPPVSQREEDLNWNGELDPRKADVAIKMVGSAKTDANGLAIVQIEYGRSLASWVDFVITVTASGVSGTEARAKFQGLLPASAEAIKKADTPPAFVISPYGTSSVCTDAK